MIDPPQERLGHGIYTFEGGRCKWRCHLAISPMFSATRQSRDPISHGHALFQKKPRICALVPGIVVNDHDNKIKPAEVPAA